MDKKELIKQKEELERQIRELEKGEREKYLARAAAYVGKCYDTKQGCVKILDVPQEDPRLSGGPYFNRYQFPACILYKEEDVYLPYYLDTVYLNIDKKVIEVENLRSREMSSGEFNALLRQRVEKFLEKVENV